MEHGIAEFTRREALRRFGIGGSVLALPGLLAACGGDDGAARGTPATRAAASDAEIESISWALAGEMLTLDPATGGGIEGWTGQALGLEGLLYLDGDFKLHPLLAEAWDVVSPTEYVFRIREGVTYWDGSPLNAEDVAFTFERHIDQKVASYMAFYLNNVQGARVTGPNEVTLGMKHPDPFILYILPMLYITPKAFTQEMGGRLGKPAGDKITTMGTGPYRFVSFSAENGLEVVRNEEYWGEKPRVLRATLKTIDNPQTQQLAVRSGEVDGLFGFDLQQSKQWDRLGGVETSYTPGMGRLYLAFNVTKAPFDDIHVRRAIVHAANREAYVEAFVAGRAVPGGATIVPKSQFVEPLATDEQVDEIYDQLDHLPFDMEAAKAELAQSAHPDGFKATVEYPSQDAPAGKAFVSLSESLKEIGIELEVREITPTQWAAVFSAEHNEGLFFASGAGAYPDPVQALVTQFSRDGAKKGGYNFANYVNPEVDRLLEQQAAETDPAKRLELITELLKMTSEDVPYMNLWTPDVSMAVNDEYVYEGFNCLYYANRAFLGRLRATA